MLEICLAEEAFRLVADLFACRRGGGVLRIARWLVLKARALAAIHWLSKDLNTCMVSLRQMLVVTLALIPALAACNSSAPMNARPQPLPATSSTAPRDIPRIQADAARCAVAIFSGDIDGLLALTHPRLIEASGGEESARQEWQQAILQSKLTSLNTKVETSFPGEPEFILGKEHEFVVIPLRVEVTRDGMKPVEQRLFPIGIRRIGQQRWGYTDGSSRESIATLFPDFPTDYEVPEATFKVLD